jgi:hypothetical protein
MFGLFFATQKYEAGMDSNGSKARNREILYFSFTYRPSLQKRGFYRNFVKFSLLFQ